MTTDNPKISAYVPQVIYDCFKQFQLERQLSMSQTAIEIFAEYFSISLSDNTQLPTSRVSLEMFAGLVQRVEELEKQLQASQSKNTPSLSSFFLETHEKYYNQKDNRNDSAKTR